MIKVIVKKQDDLFTELKISGHAEYDESGKDIVCAAVSSASILTVNGIELFGKKDLINVTEKDGYLKVKVNNSDETVQTLIQNLMNALTELELDYPKYIKIEK